MVSRAVRTARQFVQYHQRVLESGPIGYWPLDEKQGTVAYDWVAENGLQNGAHTGVTLYQPGIGDGRTSPFYDGTNDFTNVLTATLAAAFDGNEGSLVLRLRVNAAGIWTDGAERRAFRLGPDANNYVFIAKNAANNQIGWNYRAGGGAGQTRTRAGMTTTDWFTMGLTWSRSANETRAYYDGVQEGATMAASGNWVAALGIAIIGASSVVPTAVWHGWLAHGAMWDRALPPGEMAALYGPGVSH